MKCFYKAKVLISNLLLLGILILPGKTSSQIQGNIRESFTNIPIPFVHISINGGYEFISDIDGNFNIPSDTSYRTIVFKAGFYKEVILQVQKLSKDSSLVIYLDKAINFQKTYFTEDATAFLISKVLKNKKSNEPDNLKHTSYSTYNKATLTPEKVDKTNHSLNKLLRRFSLKFTTFQEKQHFLIIESATEKKIHNKLHKKETITGAKSTILDVPTLFIQTTQIHSISPYEDFLNVGGTEYVSPLADKSLNRYSFSILDTIRIVTDTIFVISYKPLYRKHFNGLKGLLYINTKNYAVQFYSASPAKEQSTQMKVLESFIYFPEKNTWFPQRIKTMVAFSKSGEIFLATVDTYLSDIDLNYFANKNQFDEVVLEYPDYANKQNDEFWSKERKIPLTEYDSNTYNYYKIIDQKKYIRQTLQFAEDYYYGFITYKTVDIDLKRLVDFNQLEGLRIGFGAHTNTSLSKRFIFGGYWGYGFKDAENKFGTDFTYKLRTKPVSFNTSLIDDVKESGSVNFPFNKPQYSSEPLRRIGVKIMDRIIQWENSIMIHPLKFLDTKVSFSISSLKTTYDYQFKNEPDNTFDFAELKLGFRYAFGEQFLQILQRKESLGSKFPIVYFNYTKGIKGIFGGQYLYDKYDFKIEYKFRILDIGQTGIQLIAGILRGDVPYSKLYNGNGSYRKALVVAHNSFETMRYNEFLSDRYISLFLSHDLGRIYYNSQTFRPRLSLIHNTGIGRLKNPEAHKNIQFKTMEKGFAETGMLLDDVIVLKLAGVRIGFGAASFIRYGPYANPNWKENFFFKFALKFSL